MAALLGTGDADWPGRRARVEVQAPEGRLALGPRAEAQVFGIGREALANVVKHAGATHRLDPGRGAAGGRARRDPRRRSRLRAGRGSSRPLRPRVDAQPRRRDRGAAEHHQRARPGHRRPDRGARRQPTGAPMSAESERPASGCSWSTITPSCGAGCGPSSRASPTSRWSEPPRAGRRRSTCSRGSTRRAGRPDVVVMDLQMRPLDGIESTRLIRARHDDVEVVVLTSYADDELVRGGAGGRSVGLSPQGRRHRRGRGGRARRGPRRAAARPRGRPAPALVAGRDVACARPRRSSPRASSRSCGWSGRAERTRRSPPGSASANGPPARTYRTSWASWVSHHARKPPCGPCARAWWTMRRRLSVARGFHLVRAMLRAHAVPTIERYSGSLRVRGQ